MRKAYLKKVQLKKFTSFMLNFIFESPEIFEEDKDNTNIYDEEMLEITYKPL